MNLHKLIFTENACYKAGKAMVPKGIMVHSTGANNPNLKRYVGPDDGLLGKNQYNNHWNQAMDRDVCVHAFIGKLADGTVATYQTLPWNMRGWHAGGSANNTHIGFEICEDGLTDSVYFGKVYHEAVELCAYLCKEYSLDPLADGVIIGHYEGAQRGIASNHGDPQNWFPKHDKSMDTFRADVKALLAQEQTPTVDKPADSGDMTDAEMFAFFKAQGLNDYGTAGLMGNLYAESSMKADNLQNSGNSKLGLSDAEYTAQVDNGIYTNFIHDGYGYGLAQWTYYSRKQALLAFMMENGVSIGDKRKQCEFIMKELQGYMNLLTTLKTAASVKEASDAVLTDYERPADQSDAVKEKRASFGRGYYDKYAAKPTPTTTTDGYYRVQVGAFKVKANAEALLQKLKDAGFDGFIKFGA